MISSAGRTQNQACEPLTFKEMSVNNFIKDNSQQRPMAFKLSYIFLLKTILHYCLFWPFLSIFCTIFGQKWVSFWTINPSLIAEQLILKPRALICCLYYSWKVIYKDLEPGFEELLQINEKFWHVWTENDLSCTVAWMLEENKQCSSSYFDLWQLKT